MSRQRERIHGVAKQCSIHIRQLIWEPIGQPSEKHSRSGGWFLETVDGRVFLAYNAAQLVYQMKLYRIRSHCRGWKEHRHGIKVYLEALELHFAGKCYRIGAGMKEHETPRGLFSILRKIDDPQVYFQDPDDEDNLGSRCMAFRWGKADGGVGRRLAIHGTSTPEKIRTNFTKGCIALDNRDVEQLFDLVRVGETIVIL